MKLKGLLIALVAGPIIAYVVSQVLWGFYAALNLISYISVSNFSDLTLGILGLTWLAIAYLGLKNGKDKKKKAKKKSLGLEKEIKIKDVKDTFMPSRKAALLEFIIIGDGKNLHQIVPYTKGAVYKSGDQEYKVENNSLLVQKSFFKPKKLTAIFRNDGTPIKIEGDKAMVTAEILSLAQRSGALSRTLKEMFSTHLDIKKIFFFVVIGIVGVVIALVMFGGVF